MADFTIAAGLTADGLIALAIAIIAGIPGIYYAITSVRDDFSERQPAYRLQRCMWHAISILSVIAAAHALGAAVFVIQLGAIIGGTSTRQAPSRLAPAPASPSMLQPSAKRYV